MPMKYLDTVYTNTCMTEWHYRIARHVCVHPHNIDVQYVDSIVLLAN